MKTKLLRSLMTVVCLFFFMAAANGFQTKETSNETTSKDNVSVSSILQDAIIPLECDAPIDPSWLKRAQEGVVTGKILEEPTVRVAYLIPSNRSPQEKGVDALQFIIRTGRDFFKDHMAYNGLDPKTFRYETEADGETPLIHVVNIPETDEQIRDEDQHKAWRNTINAAGQAGLGIWQPGEIWLLVAETHLQRPDGSLSAEIALGSGSGNADNPGVAVLGSTKLTLIGNGDITDNGAYHGMIIPEIGAYPLRQNVSFPWFEGSTLSAVVSSTVGAFVHELSHAMGLGHHDNRNDRNFHGNLMGNGLRGIRGQLYPDKYPEDYTRLAYASALALNTNHFFNSGMQRNQVDEVSFSLRSNTPVDGKLVFYVSASDMDGLSMFQLFGVQGFSVEKRLSGTSFTELIHFPYFEPGLLTTFRLKLYDQQGNKTERDITVTPQPGNRAPWPYVNILPPIGEAGDTFGLNWEGSVDPDTGSEVKADWDIAWDLDNDDIFDAIPQSNSPTTKVNLPAGNHLVRLKLTEPSGAHTISTPVALHVSGDPPPKEVNFTLIDAYTNKAIPGFDPIPEGAELDLASLPSKLSIRANIPDHFESVRFDIDGEENFRIENVEPYALFGDIEGDYTGGSFSYGPHTLSATAFTQDGAKGPSVTKGILRFSVTIKAVSFTLVDADTNEDLYTIENGMRIPSFSMLNKNIRTSHDVPREDLKVHFKLTGPIIRTWTEHSFPYALFGDIDGNYNGVKFPAGTYNLKADFEFRFAQCCESWQFNTEVTFDIVESAISHFTINISPFTGEPKEFNTSGLIFSPNDLPFSRNVAISAITKTEVGSVEIGISGPITHSRIENIKPYSLFGDIDGNFNSRMFPEGEYELTATPYSEANGQGVAGKALTVSFRIVEGIYILNGARLIAAENKEFLDELLSANDGNLTLRSRTDNATVVLDYDCINGPCPASVSMSLSGGISSSRIENERPFTLFGDQGGNFMGQTLPVGEYTLTFTPFTLDDGMGIAGATTSANFRIVNTFVAKKPVALLYPNPARENIVLKTDNNSEISGNAVLYDFLGREVKRVPNFDPALEQSINVSDLSPGIYLVQIYTGKTVETKKLVVQ